MKTFTRLFPFFLIGLLIACNFLNLPFNSPATQTPQTTIQPAEPQSTSQPDQATTTPTSTTSPELPAQPIQTAEPVIDLPPLTVTDQLSTNGPWLIIRSSDGLWAANADGSALKLLVGQYIAAPLNLQNGAAPGGGLFAYYSSIDETMNHKLTLNLVHLPDGNQTVITPLTNNQNEPGDQMDPGTTAFDVIPALIWQDSIVWSHDGLRLAFIGAQDGPSADTYVYDLKKLTITRLTDGPSQAYGISWSPDDVYLIQFGATSFGTGAGYTMAGAWAVPSDNSTVKKLYTPDSSGEESVGWADNRQAVVFSFSMMCGNSELRLVNLETTEQKMLYEGCFNAAATDPQGNIVMAGQDGIYLGSANKAMQKTFADVAYQVKYVPDAGGFAYRMENGQWKFFQPGSSMIGSSPVGVLCGEGVFSSGAFNAYAESNMQANNYGVWINGPGLGDSEVFNQPADYLSWEPLRGENLFFINDGTLYIARWEDNFVPRSIGKISGDIVGTAWVKQ